MRSLLLPLSKFSTLFPKVECASNTTTKYSVTFLAGTHQHSKFVTPDEMRAWLPGDMRVVGTQGLEYNVLLGKWSATSDLSVNYMMCGCAPSEMH